MFKFMYNYLFIMNLKFRDKWTILANTHFNIFEDLKYLNSKIFFNFN